MRGRVRRDRLREIFHLVANMLKQGKGCNTFLLGFIHLKPIHFCWVFVGFHRFNPTNRKISAGGAWRGDEVARWAARWRGRALGGRHMAL